MTQKVMRNFKKRLQQCIAAQWRHLEDVIYKNNPYHYHYFLFQFSTQNGNHIALFVCIKNLIKAFHIYFFKK